MGKPAKAKPPAKGLAYQLNRLKQGFQLRLERVLDVIDDALNSEALKDRIWAVEQLMKRILPGGGTVHSVESNPRLAPKTEDLASLSDEALTRRIQQYIRQYQKKHPMPTLPVFDGEDADDDPKV